MKGDKKISFSFILDPLTALAIGCFLPPSNHLGKLVNRVIRVIRLKVGSERIKNADNPINLLFIIAEIALEVVC